MNTTAARYMMSLKTDDNLANRLKADEEVGDTDDAAFVREEIEARARYAQRIPGIACTCDGGVHAASCYCYGWDEL